MKQKMYQEFKINNLIMKNRMGASAMFEYGSDSGRVTDKIKRRYDELTKGGIGLVISGMHAVSMSGATAPIMVNVQDSGYEDDIREIAEIAHKNNCKFFVQLQHCGPKTWQAEGFDHFAVSQIKVSDELTYHEATKEELKKVVSDFAAAAVKCKKAGVDGIQIHGAHGYLVNTFLSPSTNKRNDEYGGAIENRARLLFEIYDSIRSAVGTEFVIGVKFPFSDLIDSTITPEESLYVCKELENKGINFIEVSSGMSMDLSEKAFTPAIKEEAPFLNYAVQVSETVSIPVISVCGYRTPSKVNEVLENTKISAVSFGRPLVREPELPNRWKEDESRAKCLSCNGCCKSFGDGIITCQIEKKNK